MWAPVTNTLWFKLQNCLGLSTDIDIENVFRGPVPMLADILNLPGRFLGI